MATAHIEPAHVITATLEILKSLKVQKDGTLPGNMGGKKYATASNVSFAVKEEFAKNSLIIEPNEELLKHEVIPHKDRLNIAVVITGRYRIISAKDGSELTISGTGDGLATGTAVASNIASTNAIKNALLRYLLISEQSVEDEAKSGIEGSGKQSAQSQKVAQARNLPAGGRSSSQDKVRAWINGDEDRKKQANDTYKMYKEEKKLSGTELWDTVAKELGV